MSLPIQIALIVSVYVVAVVFMICVMDILRRMAKILVEINVKVIDSNPKWRFYVANDDKFYKCNLETGESWYTTWASPNGWNSTATITKRDRD